MNNKTQQRFDKSIRDALRAVRETTKHSKRIDVTPPKNAKRQTQPKGRLYLDPLTGATIWEPRHDATTEDK